MQRKLSRNPWTTFWNQQTIWSDTDWQINARQFLLHFPKLHRFTPSDTVLDIGCGEGALAERISPFVKHIYCVDTSARFIRVCRKKFSHRENISVRVLPPTDYTDLSFLKPNTFSVITCLSVVQYYRSVDEFESLLASIKSLAKPGAICLIGDIPVRPPTFKDALSLIFLTITKYQTLHFIRILFKARFSDYYRLRKSSGLLILTPVQIYRLLAKLHLKGKLIDTPLSPNTDRRHLVIYF